MRKAALALLLTILAPALFLAPSTYAAGSTIPFFVVDANNSSTFTFTGSSVNSSVTESANSAVGTATNLTWENSTVTNSIVFGPSRYLTFSNNVKPDLTNGASLQMVSYFSNTSYGNSWPRVLTYGSTAGWGSGYDEFSIQLSDIGQLQVYMSRFGTTGVYTCGTTYKAIVEFAFAMYSIQVGPGGVCNISVNGSAVAATTNEATVNYSGKVPNTSSTLNLRVGSMTNAVQSVLSSGKIRSVILSAGTSATNSVTFMENGGTGYMASQIGSTSTTLSLNTFTRAGYTFTGWNTAPDGTGTNYGNSATYNFASSSNMLFAQWAVVPPSISVSAASTTYFRTATPLTATINTAGTYTFYESGKRIPGCISKVAAPTTVTCSWKASRHGRLPIYVSGKVNSSTYLSNTIYVQASSRSNPR